MPAGDDHGPSGEGEPDPASVDAILRRARWLAALLTCVQFALYAPPPGYHLPFSRWWGAVPVGLLIAINLGALRRARSGTSGDPRWALQQVVADAAVVSLLIGMFSFDPTSALWTLIVMPVLEATVRGWSRRALIVFAVLAPAYVLREVVVTFAFHRHGSTVDAVTYRIGILGIVTVATAGLAARLTRQISDTATAQAQAAAAHEDAEQLRDLAVATRRMSSLDVPTVVREVSRAAATFGFSGVQLRSRTGAVFGDQHGAGAWRPSEAWFVSAAASAEDVGYATFEGDAAGQALAPGQVLAVAAVTAGETVEALLVGRHDGPVPVRDGKGLAMLAAQASAALSNALRFEEGRAYEQRLTYQATHDSLTGLPNRDLLREEARSAIARARQDRTLAAVVYIDLDRFKEINDVLGHATGDRLLQQVARRVLAHLRPGDICARVGGDEFVVLTGGHPDDASVVAAARHLRAVLLEPFAVADAELDIDASLGVAWAPTHGDDVDVLLRRADVAMYAAKNRREGVVVYQAADDRLTPLHLSTLGDLRRALESPGQLEPHFQPIVELAGGRLTGVEALVRWHHPARGEVMPDDFIPVAEGTSVIHQVTDRVLELALASRQQWAAQGVEIELAVNVSARALLDASFSRRLAEAIDGSGAHAGALRLEITESTLLADPARAVDTMHEVRDLGVSLSIDDFGTGYSSMNYLRTLPLDEIKIDRSFVMDMVRSSRDAAVVHSVVDLAHSLGLRVVAEGVEDQEVLDALARAGCDMAQGFHVARPMPAAALLSWAQQRPGVRLAPPPVDSTAHGVAS